MDQREFNKEMGSYLKKKKNGSSSPGPKKGFFESLKDMFRIELVDDEPAQPQQDESVSVEEVEAVMRGESVDVSEDDFDEEAFVQAHKPKGFWASLKESMFGSFNEEELLHDDEPDVAVIETPGKVDDDVKEMLRTCVSWINRLPAEEISRIKRSPEYDQFKELLRKYKLIKE